MAYQGQLARKLSELQDAARRLGAQNRPSSNSATPDDNEVALESEARAFEADAMKHLDSVVTSATSHAAEYQGRVAETAAQLEELLHDESLELAARQRLETERSALVKLNANELVHLADLNYFKLTNKISREAVYPDDHVYHFALIFTAIVIETLANAFFFRNEAGLLGGALVAFLTSLVNIGFAVLLGHMFTYKNHTKSHLSAMGYGFLALFVAWAAFINTYISCFRFQYQSLLQTGSAETIAAATSAFNKSWRIFLGDFPYGQFDFMSFLLFLIGSGLAIFAFYKGYRVDDAYPGYGAVHRRWRAAREHLDLRIDETQSGLRRALADHRRVVSTTRLKLMSDAASLDRTKSAVEGAKSTCKADLAAIARDFVTVRNGYRQCNVAVRTTPAPSYFSHDSHPIAEEYEGGASSALATLDVVINQYKALQARVLQPIAAKEKQLASQAASLEAGLFRSYATEVRQEAEEDIAARGQVMPTTGKGHKR